jgi:glycerophosphoryl diester phosphodiesterase
MAAFRGAVTAGAHAIETDVHLSSDGIAVISHVSQTPTPIGRYKMPIYPYLDRLYWAHLIYR